MVSAEKRRLAEELHAPARRNFLRRRVVERGYDDLWQADIVEMRPYARVNKGNNYILTVIDVLSKFAWALPLKTKGAKEVTGAFEKIFGGSKRSPTNMQTDRGKEFYNSDVRGMMTRYDINHYSTHSVMKASVVERFNRTLKNAMWKMFTLKGSYRWIDDLQRLLSEYNNSVHRTIGTRPVQVTPAVAKRLLKSVFSVPKIAAPGKFKINDAVRVSKFKTIFAKGYTPNWSTEIFRIVKVQRTNPVTYLLEDSRGVPVAGGFYEYELLKTAHPDVYLVERVLRRKGNQAFVKWLGFDNSHNSWIKSSDIL